MDQYSIKKWIDNQGFFNGRNALTIAIMAQDTQYIEPFSPL